MLEGRWKKVMVIVLHHGHFRENPKWTLRWPPKI